ncbi:polyphenol oxidase family protein [Ferrimicrobium sp.]|uniref:polyphenol oxidase family protein n=1 Tax=Ferrimicrobium sp. TaxID=2926050 RepID=UPI00262E4C41|nr:polyphenol oxidase family protein [Ferrimicrobium sp.]
MVFTDRVDVVSEAVALIGGGGSPAQLNQVHSAKVVMIDESLSEAEPIEADGIYIPAGHRGLASIRTADCLPLVVANRNGDAVVLHVGWRGLTAGIVEAGLAHLGGDGLVAVIGPHIRSCCYEFLGPERYVVAQRFGQASFVGDNLSLELALSGLLLRQRVQGVVSVDQCTFCNDVYHSYRRDGTPERQMTLVGAGRP